jgi:hypothetical protein
MTRGKHGASAATRRAIAERDSEIEMYRKNVARLTAENKALKERIAQQDQSHRREMRRLRAERDEGLSPMVPVLQGELTLARQDADEAQRAAIEIKKHWERGVVRVGQTLGKWGLGTPERAEFLLQLLGPDPDSEIVIVADGNARHSNSRERIRSLQRARGERR